MPTSVDRDLEAQPQCAWSTIPVPVPILTGLTVNRGLVLSRHDDPPTPSLLPCPDDTPPAYTYPPPIPPISGSDPITTRRTVDGHNLYATVIAVVLTVALFATAVFFSFFDHSKV